MAIKHETQFCKAADGATLAYSVSGSGPAVIRTGSWFTHLDFELTNPDLVRRFEFLSQHHTLLRYDMRRTGLSSREACQISLEAMVSDISVIATHAGLDKFALFGISQGGAIAIAYATAFPEQVTHLVLLGGYAQGGLHFPPPNGGPEGVDTLAKVIRIGWGADDPSLRNVFSSQFMPEASAEALDWHSEMQRKSAAPDVAEELFRFASGLDVTGLLGEVKAPTLILHSRGDRRVPIESSRQLAASIHGAKLVEFDCESHIADMNPEIRPKLYREISDFFGDPRPRTDLKSKFAALSKVIEAVERSLTYKLLVIIGVLVTLVSFAMVLL